MSLLKELVKNALRKVDAHRQQFTIAYLDHCARRALEDESTSSAFAYASQLIAYNHQAPEGYWRLADVHFAQHDYETASRLYYTALELSDYSILSEIQPRLDTIRRKLRKVSNPWALLPRELVHAIFEYMPGARVTCMGVCRAWRNQLSHMLIWDNMTLVLLDRVAEDYARDGLPPYIAQHTRRLQIDTIITLRFTTAFLLQKDRPSLEHLGKSDEAVR